MGASIIAYWPGITDEQLDSQPGFFNDDRAWGNFMAERESEEATLSAFRRLNAGALLTFTTNGVADEDVDWVTPQQLRAAAVTLRDAVKANHPDTRVILEIYGRNANGIDPIEDEFNQDLSDIEAIANWAEEVGASRMTLEVNW
jgi:hypothetical protein